MSTIQNETDTQEQEDSAQVRRLFAQGKRVTDPELIRRIRERSAAARKAIFERNGLLDIAVRYIREFRNGEE